MLKPAKSAEFFTNRVTDHFKNQMASVVSKMDNSGLGTDTAEESKRSNIKLFDKHGVPTRALWDRFGESVRNGFIDTMKNNSVAWRAASYILHPVKHIKRALQRGKPNEASEPDNKVIQSEKKVSRVGRFIGRMASTLVSNGITDFAKYLADLPKKQERSRDERVGKNRNFSEQTASGGKHDHVDKPGSKTSKAINATMSYLGREVAPRMAPHVANLGERVRRANQVGHGTDDVSTDSDLIPSSRAIAKSASKAASKAVHEAELVAASYVDRLGENLKRSSQADRGSGYDTCNRGGSYSLGKTARKAGAAAVSAVASDARSVVKARGVRFLNRSERRPSQPAPTFHEHADNPSSDYSIGKTAKRAGLAAASVAASGVGSSLGNELGRKAGKHLGAVGASKGVHFLKNRLKGTHQTDDWAKGRLESGNGDYAHGTTLIKSVSDVAPDLGLAAGAKVGSALGMRAGSALGMNTTRYLGRRAETVGQNAPEGVNKQELITNKPSAGAKDSDYKPDLDVAERADAARVL